MARRDSLHAQELRVCMIEHWFRACVLNIYYMHRIPVCVYFDVRETALESEKPHTTDHKIYRFPLHFIVPYIMLLMEVFYWWVYPCGLALHIDPISFHIWYYAPHPFPYTVHYATWAHTYQVSEICEWSRKELQQCHLLKRHQTWSIQRFKRFSTILTLKSDIS